MSRRDWPLMVRCGHEGCTEQATYRYQTRRDLVTSFEAKNYTDGRWRCIRHRRVNEVLSAFNPETRTELTVTELPSGRYFGNSGFIYGPGFKAFAKDFPPGTKVIVSATLVPPTQGIETGTAKTEGLGPKDESPVAESDAPNSSQGDHP